MCLDDIYEVDARLMNNDVYYALFVSLLRGSMALKVEQSV